MHDVTVDLVTNAIEGVSSPRLQLEKIKKALIFDCKLSCNV
ncbi:hypothetical protein ES319_A02G055000v1 [Gossypium barbadense]|uniref:Uncharacterized protein n=2 Tax=Gossypium TaxID=3633 RepID=A0A5J5WKL9_GOSBA|nr:hypothetical protein ES319_A02G055000v1 [Gossypium barbadense]TYH27335.1 hypothetical protein ES288_A02G061800v1 [Gossypium darwinii]